MISRLTNKFVKTALYLAFVIAGLIAIHYAVIAQPWLGAGIAAGMIGGYLIGRADR